MPFWDKNIQAIKKRDHDLFKKLENYELQEEQEYIVEQARDGSDILGVMMEGRKVMLNSTYRPSEEAIKYAGKIQLTENSVIVFHGLGNGLIVSEILHKLNEEATLFVYEPSAELFFFALHHFDMSDVLKDKRVILFVEGIDDDMLSNYLTLVITNINVGVTIFESHPKYKELFPSEHEKLDTIYNQCRDSAVTNLRTIINRSRLMTENAIANIPYMLRSKIATDYIKKFPKDMPAIIVSGGPSLDKNYEVLKQAKGKALIIAVDRTAKYLLDRGIEPDMFCALDYNKRTSLFRDERLRDIPFLYMPDLSNRVMNTLDSKNLIYGTGDFMFHDSLIREYGKEPINIAVGGSVATFAYGFARSMGFKRTILVGQDLALTGGEVYSGGYKNKRKEVEEFEHMMVPGNVEEMVETRGDFYVYLIWFNQAVKEAEGKMEVINATEGGARIEGTKVMTLQEAVDTYCVKEYDIREIFDAETHIFPQDKINEVFLDLQNRRKEIARLKSVAKEASEAARRCGVLTERGDRGREFREKNKILSTTSKIFDEDENASLVNKYVENIMLQNDIDLYVTEDDQEKEMLRLYQKLEHDYRVINENIDELLVQYDAMLQKVVDDFQLENV